jgi:hypothetical protein
VVNQVGHHSPAAVLLAEILKADSRVNAFQMDDRMVQAAGRPVVVATSLGVVDSHQAVRLEKVPADTEEDLVVVRAANLETLRLEDRAAA